LLQEGVVARVATTETPPPILAVVADPHRPVAAVVAAAAAAAAPLVVLAGLGDPGNLGTVVRSAAAAGAAGAVTVGGVDPANPKAVRATAGARFRIPLAVVGQDAAPTAVVAAAVSSAGLPLIGATVTGGTPPDELDLGGAFALVIGNEAHGLDAAWGSLLDERITIPMASAVESVNVAMAATVVLFEAARQRSWRGPNRAGAGGGVG
jgi:TrmH family RNA methyltransferase